MKSIDLMIEELIGREGGYSDHPADKGGPTRWGVTEQVARAYGYTGTMRTLPRALAVTIYRKRYWERPGFDDVGDRYRDVAIELFDTGVNMGTKVAATFLQVALNVFNADQRHYPDIAEDGDIGPMTIAALDSYRQRRGDQGGKVLARALDCLQGARYIDISKARPKNEAFTYGWFANRIGDLA